MAGRKRHQSVRYAELRRRRLIAPTDAERLAEQQQRRAAKRQRKQRQQAVGKQAP